MKTRTIWHKIQILVTMGAVLILLIPVFLSNSPWPVIARDYLESNGIRDSGAINLVSSIYLGYRAFDTLGETIVLLVAILGTLGLMTQIEAILAKEHIAPTRPKAFNLSNDKRSTHTLRTHLLEVVTGKLGPIVLLFGFYVMLYGHLSPGGGFQGGVIVASGIIFLALGSGLDSSAKLSGYKALRKIEAAAFLLLIIVSMSGIFIGEGFFGDPFENMTQLPAGFIILLNAIIGLKVGTSIGLMCIAMMGRKE
jgi:multicomponent Na+:H+ antiporter subunit B